MHSKVGIKKPTKYIGCFWRIYATKYTLSWNKKRLQNKSKISNLFRRLFCSNLPCTYICRAVLQKMIFFPNGAPHAVWKNIVYVVTLRDKYAVSWNREAYSKFPT